MTFSPSADFLAALADPETHEPLSLATEPQLEALRAAIGEGRARRHDGEAPETSFEGAFLSKGGRWAYLVSDGVPSFLVESRVELDEPLR